METKKNVAFLLTKISKRGGISRVVSILSNDLHANSNYKIHLISYQQRETVGYQWNENIECYNLVEDGLSMKKGIFKAAFKLRKILHEQKIDILICCGHTVGPLGILSTLFKKTKIIYWSHSSFKATTSNRYRVFNEQITAPFSKVIVSLTKADKLNYQKLTWSRKVVQIYNPIDPKLESMAHLYDINSNKIISVGRITTQKNFLLLVDVAKIVLDNNPQCEWHIYGSGEQEDKVRNKIMENNLERRLILKGQCSNLYDIYNDYSFLVMTSIYEGFPMSLIEGLSCRLPLVSFDIPTGPNEIIKNGYNGFLIEPFDINDMAHKIEELLKDSTKRLNFSKSSAQNMEYFTIHTIRNQWVELIESI